ncbi:hypothetical protein Calkr_0207 [Caldicellulosiruptor acetigenus I77R1B]|uniref:Uncharacterized protein n=1 Tax=Caldicellulosiruptor acetigenus (strain ATCC 700853 / DSM 12137 / I77R1B) TaxID=632335 RepID=E4S701_CALA7|nr:DUF5412 family protein [Caldicellulosiruptor acetigenus]ADQ39776.1 hypothetical protein Calkr_0207 [Caldicellulosiruptor acetigenus I77R1B]WAM36037.1 DUF5412 domain-containing protein [Caldicellulosiruptor acetigenus]
MSKVYKSNGLTKINVCFFKKILIKVLKIILILTLLFSFLVYWLFFDMNRLPHGEFLNESLSPNRKYKLKFYLCNGGATTAFAIRGELCYKNGLKIRNIYWNYPEDKADVKWINNHVVIINGHRLDIFKESFDFRKESVKRMIEGIIEKNRGGGLH